MASFTAAVNDFKSFKNSRVQKSTLNAAFQGLRNKIIVPVASGLNVEERWEFLVNMLQIVWSPLSSGSVISGGLFSLLSMFSEQPAQLLRTLIGDPDIEIQIIEITGVDDYQLTIASRGDDYSEIEDRYYRIARAPNQKSGSVDPFTVKDLEKIRVRTVEELQTAVATVTLQIWVLLTKAVTAPDTARDSERKRWVKYLQQKRVDRNYRLDPVWLDIARERLGVDLPLRRYMVEILIQLNSSVGVKGRIMEMILDIGDYISEAGLAGFILTVKYGIETRYPALALNELQGDLSTILELMKSYRELGARAPYLVILEDSAQVKFTPGNYPLLYSYAMGIGTTLDKSMAGLIYDKSYLEPSFFRLGQRMVHQLEGNIDSRMAQELGLTEEQKASVTEIVRTNSTRQEVEPQQIRGAASVVEDSEALLEDLALKEYYDRPYRSRTLLDTRQVKWSERQYSPRVSTSSDQGAKSRVMTKNERDKLMQELNDAIKDSQTRRTVGTVKADIHAASSELDLLDQK
ncbi:MAG: nucleocapsid protein [Ochotona cansus jeilongvirus]|uniref:Nucleocapsid n=2 Tax=Jeilongvirus TaxID=2560155 RepID=A0AAT9TT95_9MONO|nr:MAG: nucleocapsid protein [Eozapus setchuanus jeilongvirus]WEU70819.1 MAG: nucleocapsid protein [Ochotona cansus jeilongvirus]